MLLLPTLMSSAMCSSMRTCERPRLAECSVISRRDSSGSSACTAVFLANDIGMLPAGGAYGSSPMYSRPSTFGGIGGSYGSGGYGSTYGGGLGGSYGGSAYGSGGYGSSYGSTGYGGYGSSSYGGMRGGMYGGAYGGMGGYGTGGMMGPHGGSAAGGMYGGGMLAPGVALSTFSNSAPANACSTCHL